MRVSVCKRERERESRTLGFPLRSSFPNECGFVRFFVTYSRPFSSLNLVPHTLPALVCFVSRRLARSPLSAGRDIVNHKLAILPGEVEMRKAFTMTKVGVRTFMWGVWVSQTVKVEYNEKTSEKESEKERERERVTHTHQAIQDDTAAVQFIPC